MFCENCGQQIKDGSRFCENCGAPVAQAQPEQTAPASPQEYQPVPEQPMQEQPAQPQEYQPQDYQPQDYQPAPAAPKKPMSKKAKMIILFSCIGAAVVAAALVVLFVVIIPMINNANKLDITKYITVSLDNVDEKNKTVYDGKLRGEFVLDYDKFIKDQKLKEGTDKYDTALYEIGSVADISVEKKSGEKNDRDYGVSFYEAKKDDVFTVTVKWPVNGDGLLTEAYKKELEASEKKFGVQFDTSDKTYDVKLGDLLNEKGIEVKEPVQADVLGYIKKNNLIYAESNSSDSYNVYVKEFKTTIGDFTFEKPSYYSLGMNILDKSDELVGYFYLEFDPDPDYRANGDELTLGYDEYYVDDVLDEGIQLTGDKITYTVKGEDKPEKTTEAPDAASSKTESSKTASSKTESSKTESSKTESSKTESSQASGSSQAEEGLSVEDAKKCVDQLSAYLLAHVYDEDNKANKGDKIEVKNIYYVHDKDSDYRRIVFIYENTTGKYFRALETDPEELTLKNGKLESSFAYFSESDPADTLEKAIENNWYLSKTYSEFYNNTQLK